MQCPFQILGIPVFWRNLPSGDLAVWHPYNPAVQSIVEPICRHRGYWRASHNNWIVFKQFGPAVLAKLESHAG